MRTHVDILRALHVHRLLSARKGIGTNFFLLAILAGVGTISAVRKGYGYSSRFKGSMSLLGIDFWVEQNCSELLEMVHGEKWR
jgi:hypothetical protein